MRSRRSKNGKFFGGLVPTPAGIRKAASWLLAREPSLLQRGAKARKGLRRVKGRKPRSGMVGVSRSFSGIRNSMPSSRAINDARLGPGVLLTGKVVVSPIVVLASSQYAMEAFTFNPVFMGGLMGRIAACYKTYRMRRVALRYVPACSSATEGSLRFALIPDATITYTAEEVSYSRLAENQFATATNPWEPCTMVVKVPSRHYSYETEYVTTTPEEKDDCIQFQVFAVWNGVWAAGTTGRVVGELEMDYELELYTITPITATPAYERGPQSTALRSLGIAARPSLNVEPTVLGDNILKVDLATVGGKTVPESVYHPGALPVDVVTINNMIYPIPIATAEPLDVNVDSVGGSELKSALIPTTIESASSSAMLQVDVARIGGTVTESASLPVDVKKTGGVSVVAGLIGCSLNALRGAELPFQTTIPTYVRPPDYEEDSEEPVVVAVPRKSAAPRRSAPAA